MEDLSQEKYLDLFSSIPDGMVAGEKSASYLYSEEAPHQIKSLNSKMRILMILRNPVDRAYSDYWHRRRNQMESLSFEEALEIEKERIDQQTPFEQPYATYGLYAKKVESYFSIFGREQCKIFIFQELVKNPREVCNKCFDFLKVGSPGKQINFEIHNKGATPKENVLAKMLFRLSRKRSFVKFVRAVVPNKLKKITTQWMNTNPKSDSYPKMDPNTRNKLHNFFEDDIMKLQELISKNLEHWLK